MGDTLVTIIAIFLAAILMFIFPLLSVSERTDDISQLTATSAVTEFVDTSRTVGKISMDNYSKMVSELALTGNSYDIEMELKVLDENIGKKTAWTQGTVIGENVYYSVYTSQILDVLAEKDYVMKEGDIFSVTAKNSNETMSQSLRSLFYSVTGKGTYTVAAQHSGVVSATGSN